MDTLVLDGSHLTLDDLYTVMYDRRSVRIDADALKRAADARLHEANQSMVSTMALVGTKTRNLIKISLKNITST